MKTSALGFLAFAAISSSLEAVKFRIEGFEGFYDSTKKFPPLKKEEIEEKVAKTEDCLTYSKNWDFSEKNGKLHCLSDFSLQIFTSKDIPLRRAKFSELPALKAWDTLKIKPFLLTEASQEVELDDVYRGTFLNICMTLRHEQEGKDKSVINAAYEVVSHSVFPESLFNEIQEVRFKFKGLDFISWEDVVGPLYEVRAQGELTIAKSQKDESYKLPYWPNSNQLTLQFTDRRQNKSDFLYYSAALNLSDFNGFVFVQNIEKTYQNFDEFRDILNSQNRKWLADLGKKSCVKDYAESGKLQIAVTAQLHMKKQNETEFIPLNFVLLSHQILPWEIQEVKDITILLTEVKIFTQNGIQTPVKYQVVLLHNDGIEKRFMNDTKWTVQRSYQ